MVVIVIVVVAIAAVGLNTCSSALDILSGQVAEEAYDQSDRDEERYREREEYQERED